MTLDPSTATFTIGRSAKGRRAWISMRDQSGETHVVGCFFGLEENFLREVAQSATAGIQVQFVIHLEETS